MRSLRWIIVNAIVLISIVSDAAATNNKKFPKKFLFGVGTSAYQIEGGWNVDGKGASMWDTYVHDNPTFSTDNGTGDVACDSYNQWQTDVQMLKDLGVQHYRFSIAWTRILPNGFADTVNPLGVAYYKNLIKALKENDIEPMVSIFHWDTPQTLQDLGGFLNSSFADWFEDYARVAFENFGDDVKYWFTFNEPKTYCNGGYGYAYNPPRIPSEGLLEYVCAHNLLRAHARAYRVYDREFRNRQKGQVSIVLDSMFFENSTANAADIAAAETAIQFDLGWYANPVHYGDYPEIMKTRIAARSAAEGRNQSRLPEFTDEEKEQLTNSTDFFSLNTYTGVLVAALPEDPSVTDPPSRYGDVGVSTFTSDDWETTTLDWLRVAPYGVQILLNWVKNTYGNPDIIITENGYTDLGGVDDPKRLQYHQDYLSYIRDSMEQDGVKVFGYTAWSLMDNYEWASGYTQKFGLFSVDFNSAGRNRTIKQSGTWYSQVTRTRCLVDQCDE